jgi:hypothetical protein
MGQHTWFIKNKELFLKQNELYEKLDAFEENKIYLDNMELLQINAEIDEIDKHNRTDYHDLFRTVKRNEDGSYTDDVIFSKEDCFKWLEINVNTISFKHCYWETNEQEAKYKQEALIRLNKFWDEYPNGVIYFG